MDLTHFYHQPFCSDRCTWADVMPSYHGVERKNDLCSINFAPVDMAKRIEKTENDSHQMKLFINWLCHFMNDVRHDYVLLYVGDTSPSNFRSLSKMWWCSVNWHHQRHRQFFFSSKKIKVRTTPSHHLKRG